MQCVKEQRFLFLKWRYVEHDYRMYRIIRFMRSSTTFHVEYKCKCGAKYTRSFVEQDELILAGISVETLNKIDNFNAYYCEQVTTH